MDLSNPEDARKGVGFAEPEGSDKPTYDELVEALRTSIRVAEEAREEWDAAPSGMRAGKLLIALIDPKLRYRHDITAMHAVLSRLGEV